MGVADHPTVFHGAIELRQGRLVVSSLRRHSRGRRARNNTPRRIIRKPRGWAASAGITIPFEFIAEDDAFSAQFTYAVDSSIFLGTQQDVSFVAAKFPNTGPTRGWSAVGSYLHNWSDNWASTAFVSYLALDVDLILTRPTANLLRYGVNLTYRPSDNWTIGMEVDALDAMIDINGPFGKVPDARIKGPTAYLWVTREF